jgi:hypothetical protein
MTSLSLSRILAVLIAAAGLALVGSAVEGLVAVDGQLEAATKRDRQERVLPVKQQRPPLCPRIQTREL